MILLATTVLASTLEIHDPRKDPRKCGRSNFNSASYICDSQKVLSSEAQERIDLIARYFSSFNCTKNRKKSLCSVLKTLRYLDYESV